MFAADYFDGQTPAAKGVSLVLDRDADELRFLAAGDLPVGVWPLQKVKVECLPQGVTELRCALFPDEVLVCREEALRIELSSLGVGFKKPLSRAALKKWAVGLLTLILVLGVTFYVSVPALSRFIAHRLPASVEDKWGEVASESFNEKECRSEEANVVLAEMVETLSLPGEDTGKVRVSVVNWPMVNAFAFPGQRIVLTRKLIEEAEGPDEVAGVLAHELEHVQQKHVVTNVVRSSILSMAWAVTVGDYAGMMVVDPTTLYQIANLRFSRDDERAADDGARRRLSHAGISTEGLQQFFTRLEKQSLYSDMVALLSTHPPMSERADASAQGMKDFAFRPSLDEASWKTLKSACPSPPAFRN